MTVQPVDSLYAAVQRKIYTRQNEQIVYRLSCGRGTGSFDYENCARQDVDCCHHRGWRADLGDDETRRRAVAEHLFGDFSRLSITR